MSCIMRVKGLSKGLVLVDPWGRGGGAGGVMPTRIISCIIWKKGFSGSPPVLSDLAARLLAETAHQHRRHGRQHRLQRLLRDARGLGRLFGDGARHLGRTEKMAQNVVARPFALGSEGAGDILEKAGMAATGHLRHEQPHAVRFGSVAPQPLAESRQQGLGGKLRLFLRQAVLTGHQFDRAPVAGARQEIVERQHRRSSSRET
jgi:hypothetical protein